MKTRFLRSLLIPTLGLAVLLGAWTFVSVPSLAASEPPPSTVEAWGGYFEGQLNVPTGLTDVIAVSAGDFHSVALRQDGTVLAWGGRGATDEGQSTVPSGSRRW